MTRQINLKNITVTGKARFAFGCQTIDQHQREITLVYYTRQDLIKQLDALGNVEIIRTKAVPCWDDNEPIIMPSWDDDDWLLYTNGEKQLNNITYVYKLKI